MKNYGTLLKKIRLAKGLSQKTIYEGIMSRQAYYLIESNETIPAFDNFLLLLERLFLTTEEFLTLLDSDLFPDQDLLFHEISQAAFYSDKKHFFVIFEKLDYLYQKTKNEKYFFVLILAKALFHMYFETNDISIYDEKLMTLTKPIRKYLLGIETWHYYELKLLSNAIYCFPPEKAITLGQLIQKKVENKSEQKKYKEMALTIYLNLSLLCLRHRHFQHALDFATNAKMQANSPFYMFEKISAILNYEIADTALKQTALSTLAKKQLHLLGELDYPEIVQEYQRLLTHIQIPF